MFKMDGFWVVLFLLILLKFVVKINSVVKMMIMMEFWVCGSLLVFLLFKGCEKIKLILIFLVLGVCEASIGFSFLVFLVRKKSLVIGSLF